MVCDTHTSHTHQSLNSRDYTLFLLINNVTPSIWRTRFERSVDITRQAVPGKYDIHVMNHEQIWYPEQNVASFVKVFFIMMVVCVKYFAENIQV